MIDTTVLVDRRVRLSEEDIAVIANIPQTTIIRNHLIRFGSITDAEAREFYGISRLSDVVYKLRYKIEPHMVILTEMVTGKNRFGATKTFGKYILVEE